MVSKVALLAVVGCMAIPGTSHATFPGANGKIAFARGLNIFTINPDGTGETQLTAFGDSRSPRWSPDGTKIAFSRSVGGNLDIYVMNADASGVTRLTTDPAEDESPAWSPDGARLAFYSSRDGDPEIYTMNADGTDQTRITTKPGYDWSPDWSPDGSRIAYSHEEPDLTDLRITTMKPDGTDQRPLIPGLHPSWSPEGNRIAFDLGSIKTVNPDGTGVVIVTPAPDNYAEQTPVWSPNAGQLVGSRRFCSEGCFGPNYVFVMNADGSGLTHITTGITPDWQRIPQPDFGYARPKGASPFQTYFTPAYLRCDAPNSTHGAPLAFPSCSAPAQTSLNVVVGTPDANGMGANFLGSAKLRTIGGGPSTSADVGVTVSLSDIRCGEYAIACTDGNLSDYTGPMRLVIPVRLTDAYVRGLAATSEGSISVPIPCSTTAAANIGSACSVSTTINSVVPGAVRTDNRAIWELGQLQIWDSGQDGTLATADDDTLFATEGLFVP
jgi:WD40 repeat protein